ncbi:TPA: hypothetical protein HA228_03015 [Candidatus Woesearchaeota archaeon]|nr:hypothetical protein [Candidatus Woesearchaeota archaeon]
MMKFVVEHLEPELFEWCAIEYAHIAEMVGKENVLFTNIPAKESAKLSSCGEVTEKKVSGLHLKKACILDPYARKTLSESDKGKFGCLILGGILGNNPAEGRTEKLTGSLPYPTRNLGKKQLSTDTAAYVAKRILEGRKLSEFHFVDEVEVQLGEGESMTLPFPYVLEDNKVVISEKLVEHLKRRKGF